MAEAEIAVARAVGYCPSALRFHHHNYEGLLSPTLATRVLHQILTRAGKSRLRICISSSLAQSIATQPILCCVWASAASPAVQARWTRYQMPTPLLHEQEPLLHSIQLLWEPLPKAFPE